MDSVNQTEAEASKKEMIETQHKTQQSVRIKKQQQKKRPKKSNNRSWPTHTRKQPRKKKKKKKKKKEQEKTSISIMDAAHEQKKCISISSRALLQ